MTDRQEPRQSSGSVEGTRPGRPSRGERFWIRSGRAIALPVSLFGATLLLASVYPRSDIDDRGAVAAVALLLVAIAILAHNSVRAAKAFAVLFFLGAGLGIAGAILNADTPAAGTSAPPPAASSAARPPPPAPPERGCGWQVSSNVDPISDTRFSQASLRSGDCGADAVTVRVQCTSSGEPSVRFLWPEPLENWWEAPEYHGYTIVTMRFDKKAPEYLVMAMDTARRSTFEMSDFQKIGMRFAARLAGGARGRQFAVDWSETVIARNLGFVDRLVVRTDGVRSGTITAVFEPERGRQAYERALAACL